MWNRTQHVSDRHRCLRRFAELYGGSQLRYTYDSFRADPSIGAVFPSERDLGSVDRVCRVCVGPAVDDCVVCA